MPGLVSDATRIWEINIYWPVGSQCAVWDPKSKGVDIWECLRARKFPSSRPLCLCSLLTRRMQTRPTKAQGPRTRATGDT